MKIEKELKIVELKFEENVKNPEVEKCLYIIRFWSMKGLQKEIISRSKYNLILIKMTLKLEKARKWPDFI
jgi:hypothetical protein